jgi:hypothetical protein
MRASNLQFATFIGQGGKNDNNMRTLANATAPAGADNTTSALFNLSPDGQGPGADAGGLPSFAEQLDKAVRQVRAERGRHEGLTRDRKC